MTAALRVTRVLRVTRFASVGLVAWAIVAGIYGDDRVLYAMMALTNGVSMVILTGLLYLEENQW